MGTIALLAIVLLIAAAVGQYRLFSYLAALFIVANFGAAAIERNDGELDLAPYTGLVAGLGVVFVVGFTVIWSQWNPDVTEYTYVLGLPVSTLAYFVFLWLLPILGALYYALVFPEIGNDDAVDDILDEARRVQRRERFPLSVASPDPDGGVGNAEGTPSENTASGTPQSATQESPQAEGGNRR